MAKNIVKGNTFKQQQTKEKKAKRAWRWKLNLAFVQDRRLQLAFGVFLIIAAVYLFTAFLSYLFTGQADQSVIEAMSDTALRESGGEVENWLGLFGAVFGYYFVFKWFGIGALLVPPMLFLLGYQIVFRQQLLPLGEVFKYSFFFIFWVGTFLGYLLFQTDLVTSWGFLSGGIGYELARMFYDFLGWGTLLVLVFALVVFVIYTFDVASLWQKGSTSTAAQPAISPLAEEDEAELEEDEADTAEEEEGAWPPSADATPDEGLPFDPDDEDAELRTWTVKRPYEQPSSGAKDPHFEVEDRAPAPVATLAPPAPKADLGFEVIDESEEVKKVLSQENYDPTLDLGTYQYPPVDLLNEYEGGKIKVSEDELRANKDKIVETLTNFKIGISSIKATIGPTVTLYEIVPEPGVKISKIKNLEDDIALSLAALGIRIIAPIPGKGTIGIEVPNKNREMVSMHSMITTEKFMLSTMELPIALGKTISNEVFITDLAKMPHLLIAGATGQGKSVGLNVLLASLLYKKHPSQLKLVLVDPKKVELTLFNKIERHFLAKLPDTQEAIITDTSKVVNTLNSLCIEMDQRYDLLKEAGCRNLKEYNAKFVQRRLNPEHGHRFLPYIVLVIDELADLMMTAGKEVETPIARLAQLARAIGIHLVVATQRPSVNVITGIIKANFPARLSFRVTSKIDSRTILDTGGAEQLVGHGDMLLSMGSDVIRIQCPFVDTPEVEDICEFIGAQRGYDSAYQLPEYYGEGEGPNALEVDLAERDSLFDEAARVIVQHQQGSTSLIQRKLKLGYNRAGRLIDQLEAAGVVGPFEGSKAREVLIQDEYSLEQLLNSISNKHSK
ncbi:FtsK/SpoIIIE family DNA translocase [Cesiribacter andamanensis]|uniref:Stage III sporulation protein E n=1 Tax=Cesiribacter andamanensis AMV16 TaxID=1279009 RepID=M7NSP9_9BACT|nr:DNA translocase FtsK [Cesiribacter andamanensis]EMR01524.1 Stage III sporulation protein E [Cesiribacter andamanensis AMV16]